MHDDVKTPEVPDNYNREHAWTDRQRDHSNPVEWDAETQS